MDQSTSLADKLQALEAEPNRYTRRIERVLPEIEDALVKGVSREAILAVLREDGIDVTLSGFSKALYRLRKKHAATHNSASPAGTSSRVRSKAEALKEDAQLPATAGELRQIARSKPDLGELARLGREANKAKERP